MSEAVRRFKKNVHAAYAINLVAGLLTGFAFVLAGRYVNNIFVDPYATGFWAVTGITLFLLVGGSTVAWALNYAVLKCPACGKAVAFVDSNFCPGCGIPIRERSK